MSSTPGAATVLKVDEVCGKPTSRNHFDWNKWPTQPFQHLLKPQTNANLAFHRLRLVGLHWL